MALVAVIGRDYRTLQQKGDNLLLVASLILLQRSLINLQCLVI